MKSREALASFYRRSFDMLEENSIFRAVSEMERVFEDLLGTLTRRMTSNVQGLGLKRLKVLRKL